MTDSGRAFPAPVRVVWFLVWSLATLGALAFGYTEMKLNHQLRDQVDLLRQLQSMEAERSAGIHRVNTLCEHTVRMFVDRLGLDPATTPLFTTAIYQRDAMKPKLPQTATATGERTKGKNSDGKN